VSISGINKIEKPIKALSEIMRFEKLRLPELINLTTKTELTRPKNSDPVSPIKILAGVQLNFRNASTLPTVANDSIAYPISLFK
jgi:hypothetical protein